MSDEARKELLADTPDVPPTKRRQLQTAPDLWLAVWATNPALTPSQRKRAQQERDRRRAIAKAAQSHRVGIVKGNEGATPEQLDAALEAVPDGAQVVRLLAGSGPFGTLQQALRDVDMLIACPRESAPPKNVPTWERSSVWAAVAYAKHRRLPVRIIMPNGKEGRLDA